MRWPRRKRNTVSTPRRITFESLDPRALLAADFMTGQIVGNVQSPNVVEASGMVASRQNRDVLWTHNDSGDSARVFAMDNLGGHRGTYTLSGMTATDWEDIAIGPGPQSGVDYLYIGDMGDNSAVRSSIRVYRVAEPVVDANQAPVTESLAGTATITLVYSDGPRDAETLLVDPHNGDMYVVTKREALSRIYRASYPQSTSQVTTLELMGEMQFGGAVGGDVSPTGLEVFVKTPQEVRLFERSVGSNLWQALQTPGTIVPYTVEPQGEAITFDGAGVNYFTVSEGANPPLYRYDRVGQPEAAYRFAIIGDYGFDGPDEAEVATLVKSWNPNFVITTGDNNYDTGSASTIDANIGKHYGEFIGNYTGAYGAGSETNRFYPSLGNHDWGTPGATPYLDYFTLLGNERYYDYVVGPVHFFVVDSDVNEPDGKTSASPQARWLERELLRSTAPYQVVYFHHAPYTSSTRGPDTDMRWPFREWGADAIVTGHDHFYERLEVDGLPYVINGSGGRSLYDFGTPVPESLVRYNDDFGAMLATVDASGLTLEFHSVTAGGTLIDRFTVSPVEPTPVFLDSLVAGGSLWKYSDTGVDQGTAWRAIGFDDSGWSSGPAQLGYGDGDEATVVSYGPDSNNKHVTTYFRQTFSVTDAVKYTDLTLDLLRDDGAVVYLNGQEVHRSNMPSGTIGYGTLASTAVGGADESRFYTAALDPAALLNGTNTIAVEVHQSAVNSSDVSFDLRLIGQWSNNPPVAAADSYSLNEDAVLTTVAPGVLANDSDADGDGLTALLASPPTQGAVILNADGSFTYTPAANFNGADGFTYQATDGVATSPAVLVTIDVTSVNDPPTAGDDAYAMEQDASLTVSADLGVLSNDADVDGDLLSAVWQSGPTSGTLSLAADGSFIYTPNAGFVGVDTFVYAASDAVASSNLATVTLTVHRRNNSPIAADDFYDVDEDGSLAVAAAGVLANDSDADGDSLSAILVSGPAHGTLLLDANGSFTYTPNANFNGLDNFSYQAGDGIATSAAATVTINVAPVPDAPIAAADSYATSEDSTLMVELPGVLANDFDADGEPLTAVLISEPTSGTLTFNADGAFAYVPSANFNGADGFTYHANDGTLSSAETSVTIQVTAVNDPPSATPQSVGTNEDTAVAITLAGQDGDPEVQNLTFAIATPPAQGTLSNFDPATGVVTYTPGANYNGNDGFSFTVTDDGTAGGAALTSTPASVLISVAAVNDEPLSGDDAYSIKTGVTLTVAAPGVLGNDNDPDGDTLTAVLLSGPTSGIVTLNSDGSLAYQSNAAFVGTDQFTYQAFDGASGGAAATVTITVNPAVVLYFSVLSDGAVGSGGLNVANEDVVAFDGTSFSLYFDGSDVGLAGFTLDAFSILAANDLLLSFTGAGAIPGISGTVDDSDIVRFTATSLGNTTAGAFSLYFDGSDVGLTMDNEDIDAIELLANGHLLVSTTGSASVPGASAEDKDLLRFAPASLGAATSGTWSVYFDGSDVGLSNGNEDVDGVAVDDSGRIYLTTTGNFSVPGAAGANEDVVVFTPSTLGASTSGSFATPLFFDGSLYGLAANDLTSIELPSTAGSGGAQPGQPAALVQNAFATVLPPNVSRSRAGRSAQSSRVRTGPAENGPLMHSLTHHAEPTLQARRTRLHAGRAAVSHGRIRNVVRVAPLSIDEDLLNLLSQDVLR
jgi:VCBS repeat-containing protein